MPKLDFSARDLAAFRDATNRMATLNHALRHCDGCRKRRSVGQFKKHQHATLCDGCITRGVTVPAQL